MGKKDSKLLRKASEEDDPDEEKDEKDHFSPVAIVHKPRERTPPEIKTIIETKQKDKFMMAHVHPARILDAIVDFDSRGYKLITVSINLKAETWLYLVKVE